MTTNVRDRKNGIDRPQEYREFTTDLSPREQILEYADETGQYECKALVSIHQMHLWEFDR